MRRGWRTTIIAAAAAVVLAAAGALIFIVFAEVSSNRIIGSYSVPNGGGTIFAIDLPGTRVALRTFDVPYNYYEFDCSTLQFVNPQYFDHSEIEADIIGWVCWACSATNLGLDFGDLKHGGIGSRATGQVLYEFPLDGEMEYMYGGMANGTEVMVVVSEYAGKTHFLNLSQPGSLGTVIWPEDYRTPEYWTSSEHSGNYRNRHNLYSYCFNSLSQTLFVPVSHEGLVYWCQIDLTSGFDYTTGVINCGVKPQWIIQSTDETAVYVFDDEANQVFAINPLTRQAATIGQFESPGWVSLPLFHQGYLYFCMCIPPQNQHIQRLVKMDPANGSVVSATLNGRVITDLDAYGGSVYALQRDEEHSCHLLELRTTDLELLDDITIGDENTIRILADQSSGRMVVDDRTNYCLVVVQL